MKMKKNFSTFLLIVIAWTNCHVAFSGVPAGYYYFAHNKKKVELKSALSQIASPLRVLDYGSGKGYTWEGFYYTDQNSDGSVKDMYSSEIRYFNGFSSVKGMHIEHSLPKSWWGGHENNAYKDLFHLYPADGVTNSTKNNFPLGEVTGTPNFDNGVSKIGKNGFGGIYTDNCFEPADEYKGDFARSYLYVSTIYENFASFWNSPMMNNNTYPVWKKWAVDLLLKWNREDPVSQKERDRIETVYSIQGNRNPFIDYPDLAEYIWGADTTKIFPFPEETEPFLIYPKRGYQVDFGVILQSDSIIQHLTVSGLNLQNNLNISLKNKSKSFKISKTSLTKEEVINGSEISITFQPVVSGWNRDTLLLISEGWNDSLLIPMQGLASTDFLAIEPQNITPTGGTLRWISDPDADNYKLNLYQGDQQAGDLIISAYVEGSSWNKALELYNGTGKSIDLSNYSLQKQSNGDGNFGAPLKLNGMLESGKNYVLVHKSCSNNDLIAKANLLTDSLLSFNGNDAVALVRNGILIDVVGIANAGADVSWGQDLTLERKSSVTHPSSQFRATEWNTYEIDNFQMLGNHQMTFQASSNYLLQNYPTGKTDHFTISQLLPENTYTYSITAVYPNEEKKALNTMQIHTARLDMPIAMDALNVHSTGFIANWEDHLYTQHFLLDVFQLQGTADTTEIETFDNVGSNGKPLPTGWTGTASGNYTSSTSSGEAPPSIALKNDGEYLQTKTYSLPVKKLSFMYRFASDATGSSLILEGIKENGNISRIDSISYVNTSKNYPVYFFQPSDEIVAFKFTYQKLKGNLALDDVAVTYGKQDTIYVLKNESMVGSQFEVSNLNENSTYYYRVRATLGNSVSDFSDVIKVQTTSESGIKNYEDFSFQIVPEVDQIKIKGLQGNERIQIFNIAGVCLFNQHSSGSEMSISIPQKGIFIVRISNKDFTFAQKLIK
jgi:predicted DNA-binding ArsR family transcriptional regulator